MQHMQSGIKPATYKSDLGGITARILCHTQGGHTLEHPSSALKSTSVAMQAVGTGCEDPAGLHGRLVQLQR